MTDDREPDRMRLDARSLRGIAHPVRVRLLRILRVDGPATATTLAHRLGMNTGATSYHLRQLGEHGFVEDIPARGSRRERWWQAVHATTSFPDDDLLNDEAGVGAAFLRSVAQVAADNMLRAVDETPTLPAEWRDAQDLSDYSFVLSPGEARELAAEVHAVLRRRYAETKERPRPADGERVTVQFQLFRDPEKPDPARSDPAQPDPAQPDPAATSDEPKDVSR